MTETEPLWLQLARSDLGVSEVVGPKASLVIKGYFRDAGHPEIEDDATAWCAAASCSWLKRSGFPIPPRATSLMAMSFETYGAPLDTFKPGAICVFYRGAKREKTWQRHVAIGVRETKTHIVCIGGNQSDSVSEQKFPKKDLVAMRWRAPQRRQRGYRSRRHAEEGRRIGWRRGCNGSRRTTGNRPRGSRCRAPPGDGATHSATAIHGGHK
jgi:uncharacterized protein (TIGR02594 family)